MGIIFLYSLLRTRKVYFVGGRVGLENTQGRSLEPQLPFGSVVAAIAASPAWHRRKRKHRSFARLRLHFGTSTWRDRHRLLLHHATPPPQAFRLMAWRSTAGKNAGNKGDSGASKGSGRWQYWQGSWSPSQHSKGAPWRKNSGKNQDGKASLSFPGYDVAQKEEQHISVVATVKEKDGDTYANALQRAINLVRKAEARTRKAMADKKSRMVQWSNWVTELKKTYAKERGRYQAAVARHEREMEEALVEQECARSSLRKVAASMEVDAGPTTQEALDVGAEFEAIMQDGLGMEDYQESNEDILQRTLQHGVARREAASKQGTSAVGGRYYSASAQVPSIQFGGQHTAAGEPGTTPSRHSAAAAWGNHCIARTSPSGHGPLHGFPVHYFSEISHWSAKEVVYTGRSLQGRSQGCCAPSVWPWHLEAWMCQDRILQEGSLAQPPKRGSLRPPQEAVGLRRFHR